MPRIRTLLLLAGDFILLLLSYLVAAWLITRWGGIWDFDFWFFIYEENALPGILLVILTVILSLYFIDLYVKVKVPSRRRLLEDLVLVFGVTFLLQAFISYMRIPLVLSRYLMVIGSMLSLISLLTWRSLFSSLVLHSLGYQRVVLVGESPLVKHLTQTISEHPEHGYQIVGVFDANGKLQPPIEGNPEPEATFAEQIERLSPAFIYVAPDLEVKPEMTNDLLLCSMNGLAVQSIGDLYEELFQRVSLQTLSTNQLVYSPAFRPKQWVIACQMLYGRLIATIGLLLVWPVMIIVAIAVRLESPGPAILRQIRLGQGGVPFVFLKFRSMYVDADARSGPVRAQENDPRITRVGRWIRLTRVDELPQLINVLGGKMTLVGPRPEMPELEKKLLVHLPLYTQRHRIRPGITGWAQIHHEPEDSISSTAKKLEYDLYYIKNMTPALDVLTLFHTFKAVLLRIGAR